MAMRVVDGFTAWSDEVQKKSEEDPNQIFAILLYSHGNTNLFKFIRNRYFTLDDLTGTQFTIFVIWYLLLNDKDGGPDAIVAASKKFTTYEIVRHFGFETERVPCLVFFNKLPMWKVRIG